jgi:hypothetical protein
MVGSRRLNQFMNESNDPVRQGKNKLTLRKSATRVPPMFKHTHSHFIYCPTLVGAATVRPDNRLGQESGMTID